MLNEISALFLSSYLRLFCAVQGNHCVLPIDQSSQERKSKGPDSTIIKAGCVYGAEVAKVKCILKQYIKFGSK